MSAEKDLPPSVLALLLAVGNALPSNVVLCRNAKGNWEAYRYISYPYLFDPTS